MILRRITALTVSALLLVGLPYAALVLLDWPRLDLSITAVLAHLRGGALPPGLGAAALILALWAVWGLYLLALAAEVRAWASGRGPRLRPLGPLQVLAATTIGASLTTPAAAYAAAPTDSAVEAPPTAEPQPSVQPGDSEGDDRPAGPQGVIQRERVLDGFGYDSADLTAAMKTDLAPVVTMIDNHTDADQPIQVTGHTDAAGDATYNRQLSQRRADAAATYLREQLGATAPPIETRGAGETELLDGASPEAQRRVEITYTVTPQPQDNPGSEKPGQTQQGQPQNTPSPTAPEGSAGSETEPAPAADEDQAVIVLKLPGGFLLTSMAASGVAAGFALGRRHGNRHPAPAPAEQTPPRGPTPAEPASETDRETTAQDSPSKVDNATVLDLGAGGLGTTGPGAPAATRSLLAAAVTTHEEPPPQVVMPHDDAETVLGAETATLLAERATSTVTVAPGLSEALTLLHTELLSHPGDDEDDDATTDAQPPRPLLLVARPDNDHRAELHALLAQGRHSGIAALLLGAWPEGTCTIADDGALTTTDPALEHLTGAHWPGTDTGTLADLIAALPTTTTHEPDRVELRVLGRVSLAIGTEPVALRRHAAYETAAYLAAHPDGVTLERATEDMWPHDNPHRAARRFHDATSALRRAQRSTGSGTDTTPLVVHENSRYRLNTATVTVDLWDLEAVLAAVEHNDTADAQARRRLQHAVAGYADFAAETDYAWAEHHRLHLRRRVLNALLRLASESDRDTARDLLAQAVAVDAYSEEAHHALIRLYLEQDDTRGAAETYRQYESALREIDAEPDARIRTLITDVE
ncbi:OmpA family protein [Streptomonospora salina]|uniref:Outer membrane protein OmpA-like peptidoglycan-associated protein/DNA-binding SARP family transcriptional activator n=1 Tax=Streptomonospora salina TaxID=104205 RepID=A0A841EC69_9ACTN|nr:OmpA family protein [Streptomonospora salina]MBB5998070.1 outer membrane protein OmpA-like peptidoglycan-associated protein/DNA-binding SARP family transcriptional activator [Streptomonospora salina]